ncbi:uncharacterized protein [Panulirus ornatus]|uniref:uncharacterized protein n=1 Tax=Panulirus ornatus TaxID=150431 RepID=UPI003A8C6A7F
MHNGGNLGKETMSRATPIMLTVVVQFVLTTTPTISEARRVMDLNYDDTRFHLQEDYRHVDPQEAQVRLSMFVSQQLQEGSSRKETIRRVLLHALQEHRRRLPDVRRQVTAGGTLNATLLRQWFSTCVHRQAANSYFHTLPLVDNQKAEFLSKFLNSTPRRWPLDRAKVGLPAAEILTEGGFSRPRESHKRVRRDGPAVMYLPVGAGGSSSDCPDSVDAAAVSISQLVFLSLSLGVFTAVANIANNINNNNNNNNNNNDNNINSNNLNFAASANSGNQITVQLPPPTGRGRRDLHDLWQAHLAALRHHKDERLNQSNIKRTQRKRREVDVTSSSFAEVPDRQTPSRGTDGNADTAATNQPRMDLNYDINYDIRDLSYDTRDVNYNTGDLNIIERESINIPLGLSHVTEERGVISLSKEQTETTSVVKEYRHTAKETSTPQDDLGSPLTDPVLEEHYQGILQIANRHGYFLPPQGVPRLLRRLFREHSPTETSAALSLSDDGELTTAPTVARPTRTSSTAALSGDSSKGILGNSTVRSSGRYSTESETSKIRLPQIVPLWLQLIRERTRELFTP